MPACPHCGARNEETHRFCLRCGRPLPRRAARRWWLAAVAVGLILLSLLGAGGLLFKVYRSGPQETARSPTAPAPTLPVAAVSPSLSPEPATTIPPTATPLPTVPPPPTNTPPPTATPPPTETPQPLPSPTLTGDPVQRAIEETIWRYCEIKAQATGPSHDESQLATVLAGEALKDQQKAVQWQRDHGVYYLTTLHWLRFEWIQPVDATHAQALVTKNETLWYYPKGWTTPSARASCELCEYQILYDLELIGGQWYITEKKVQD